MPPLARSVRSPVDEVKIRGELVTVKVAEQSREVFLKEDFERGKVFQHLDKENSTAISPSAPTHPVACTTNRGYWLAGVTCRI